LESETLYARWSAVEDRVAIQLPDRERGAVVSHDAGDIDQHYGQAGLSAKILTALRKAGTDLEALTRDDLASFDEQHDGGRESTRELARLAGLRGMYVLDVGSGLGGPARTLAAEYGCRVIGLDPTEEFCRAATMLTARVGLQESVVFRHGSAQDMPFETATFDAVWTQGVLMHIRDKARFFADASRMLRPGGRLAFQASLEGPEASVCYPTLWADDAQQSFIVSPEECRQLLMEAGFSERVWHDATAEAVADAQIRRNPESERASLQDIILTTNLEERLANRLRNYSEGRVVQVMAVFECVG
jgi:SAM-dependent methyltransferase